MQYNIGNKVVDRWYRGLGTGIVTKVTSALTVVQYQGITHMYESRQLLYLQKSAGMGC